MSGWIKLEKDLREDPRFTRMVNALIAREAAPVTNVTQARYISNAATSRVLGSLALLWMYADSHIREDDTLDLGADEVDQLVGLEGFVQLMPADWLEVIDAHSVKLPGFHEHNGTAAKKKALTNKRVARHRIRQSVTPVAQEKRSSVTAALPDQTETRPRPDSQNARENPWQRAERILAEYPRGIWPESDKIPASKHIDRILGDGLDTDEGLRAKVAAFREQQHACGNIGTKFIPRPSRFLDPVAGQWRGPFPQPQPQNTQDPRKAAEIAKLRETEDREWADLRRRASDSGFRPPGEGESQGAYRTLLERHEAALRDSRKGGPVSAAALLPRAAGAT